MNALFTTIFPWTLTNLHIAATPNGICSIQFSKSTDLDAYILTLQEKYNCSVTTDSPILSSVREKLTQYFAGQVVNSFGKVDFLEGTDFQKSVWEKVSQIKYGQFKTYKQIAIELGKPNAIRAVGTANGANPVPILIPCHRVIASNGGLGGYSGGLDVKDALLRLEGAVI